MVARQIGATPAEPHYPRCDTADHCYQANYDRDAAREILDAQQKVLEDLHRRSQTARQILTAGGPDAIPRALAALATTNDTPRGDL